jgi:3-oxoacyl-[acyl-carrier protein] reductase
MASAISSSQEPASQVALVTGAAHGFGTEIARALHRTGCRVALADIDGAAARRAAREIDAGGTTAVGLELDVRAAAHFDDARDELIRRWGTIEVLVNNAAVTLTTPTLEIPPDEFAAVLAVNAGGTFTGCQIFGRYFKARGYGRIVNVASLAGQNGGTATGAHYAASKGAILTLTRVFARELAAFGVTVNAVAPGPLDLPSVHRLVPAERLAALIEGIPVKTLGNAAFAADIVARLAARDAGYATGATWDVNGGLLMR